MAETVEVPFQTVGNRKCITVQQTMEHPHLLAFVRRFPACFEYDAERAVYWYSEPE